MCCKSSSGAGVVWMETTLERLGSNPSHEKWQPPQGYSTKQLLYLGAEVMPEEHKPKVSLCTESKSGGQGCRFNSHGCLSFFGHSSL